jgi:uncharacterized protein (DUF486 family)
VKKFVENLANLVKVKTIVTLVVLAVFAVLALRGDITADNVMVIVSTVVAFYFGTQHEKAEPIQILEGIAVEEPEQKTE